MYLLSDVQVIILGFFVFFTILLNVFLTRCYIRLSKQYDKLNNSFNYHVISAPPLKAKKRTRKADKSVESVGSK